MLRTSKEGNHDGLWTAGHELHHRTPHRSLCPIESWAVACGHALAQEAAPRRLGVLVVPGRTRAAVFAALGFMTVRAREIAATEDAANRFLDWLEKPAGTKVWYVWKGERRRGELCSDSEQMELKVSIKGPNQKAASTCIVVPPRNVYKLSLRDEADTKRLGTGVQLSGDEKRHRFVERVLPKINGRYWETSGNVDVALTGSFGRLKEDLEAPMECGEATGTLADVLLPGVLVSSGVQRRCRLFHARPRLSPSITEGTTPSLYVMDGAKAWLYGRDLYPNAHHLVVLDRREADLDEAAEEVRRALRLRREAGMAILPPLPPPLCESVDVLRR